MFNNLCTNIQKELSKHLFAENRLILNVEQFTQSCFTMLNICNTFSLLTQGHLVYYLLNENEEKLRVYKFGYIKIYTWKLILTCVDFHMTYPSKMKMKNM